MPLRAAPKNPTFLIGDAGVSIRKLRVNAIVPQCDGTILGGSGEPPDAVGQR
jgi:hypothetical protein